MMRAFLLPLGPALLLALGCGAAAPVPEKAAEAAPALEVRVNEELRPWPAGALRLDVVEGATIALPAGPEGTPLVWATDGNAYVMRSVPAGDFRFTAGGKPIEIRAANQPPAGHLVLPENADAAGVTLREGETLTLGIVHFDPSGSTAVFGLIQGQSLITDKGPVAITGIPVAQSVANALAPFHAVVEPNSDAQEWPRLAPGVHTVGALLRDGQGASTLIKYKVTVTNSAPRVTLRPQPTPGAYDLAVEDASRDLKGIFFVNGKEAARRLLQPGIPMPIRLVSRDGTAIKLAVRVSDGDAEGAAEAEFRPTDAESRAAWWAAMQAPTLTEAEGMALIKSGELEATCKAEIRQKLVRQWLSNDKATPAEFQRALPHLKALENWEGAFFAAVLANAPAEATAALKEMAPKDRAALFPEKPLKWEFEHDQGSSRRSDQGSSSSSDLGEKGASGQAVPKEMQAASQAANDIRNAIKEIARSTGGTDRAGEVIKILPDAIHENIVLALCVDVAKQLDASLGKYAAASLGQVYDLHNIRAGKALGALMSNYRVYCRMKGQSPTTMAEVLGLINPEILSEGSRLTVAQLKDRARRTLPAATGFKAVELEVPVE